MSARKPGFIRAGFEDAVDPPTRRALFDLSRLVTDLERRATLQFLKIEQQLATLVNTYTGQWTFKSGGGVPPGTGNVTGNGPGATFLYISDVDKDGVNRSLEMTNVASGDEIYLRGADADEWIKYTVTSAVDSGAHFTFGVTEDALGGGTVNPNSTITVDFYVQAIP